jgi:hypothetical protein
VLPIEQKSAYSGFITPGYDIGLFELLKTICMYEFILFQKH